MSDQNAPKVPLIEVSRGRQSFKTIHGKEVPNHGDSCDGWRGNASITQYEGYDEKWRVYACKASLT